MKRYIAIALVLIAVFACAGGMGEEKEKTFKMHVDLTIDGVTLRQADDVVTIINQIKMYDKDRKELKKEFDVELKRK